MHPHPLQAQPVSYWQSCVSISKAALKEILMLIPIMAVAMLLFAIAAPLMADHSGGLDGRYLPDVQQAAQVAKAWWQGASAAQRTMEVSTGLGYVFALWAILGWFSLRAAAYGRATGAPLILGLSGLGAAVIEAFGIGTQVWLVFASLFFFFYGNYAEKQVRRITNRKLFHICLDSGARLVGLVFMDAAERAWSYLAAGFRRTRTAQIAADRSASTGCLMGSESVDYAVDDSGSRCADQGCALVA